MSRLDYWLVSNNLQDFVNTADTIPAIKTDHVAVELNVTESNQNSEGPGFGKMNVSLLEGPNFRKELKQNIPLWKTMGTFYLTKYHFVHWGLALVQYSELSHFKHFGRLLGKNFTVPHFQKD